MARIKVNRTCNVLTGEHSNAYHSPNASPAPEITVPHLRLRLAVWEAKELAEALMEAVQAADEVTR